MTSEALVSHTPTIEIQKEDISALAGYAEKMRGDLEAQTEESVRELPRSGELPFMSQRGEMTTTFVNQEADFYDELVWWMGRGTSLTIERNSEDRRGEPRFTVSKHDETPEVAPTMRKGRELEKRQLERLLDGLFPMPASDRTGSSDLPRINGERRSRIAGLDRGQQVQIKPPARPPRQ